MSVTFASLVWFALLIAFIAVEAATAGLVSIWFAAGAAAALIVSAFTSSWVIMISVFVIVSAVSLALTRPLMKKRGAKDVRTNADLNIGRKAHVISAITPDIPGRVRLDGVDWSARSESPIPEGALCVVLSVDGATLTVRPDSGN